MSKTSISNSSANAVSNQIKRPEFFELKNGSKAKLAFSDTEYRQRLEKLRKLMSDSKVDVMLLTSMHNIAYYSGFLYCSFGRPYACVVTMHRCVTISANIDGGQPWRRSFGENLIYTDWKADNYWRALKYISGNTKHLGIESDHMTLVMREVMADFFKQAKFTDLNRGIMQLRMIKSVEEIELIKAGAHIADIGGEAIRDAIFVGTREIDVAMAGRNAMEIEIAQSYPDSELRDSWVWFQAGLNTDGAHNPVTTAKLKKGDILSLNCFPMISGYYTALERTLFLGEPDSASLKIWQANVGAHELGISLIKPGVSCSAICAEINRYFEDLNLLKYRSFGYGHSFGLLSHYYGREAGLELREDVDTVLQAGMVVSMEPMLTLPLGLAGAGGYREHDILVIGENRQVENITHFPYGPEHNIISPKFDAQVCDS